MKHIIERNMLKILRLKKKLKLVVVKYEDRKLSHIDLKINCKELDLFSN